MNRNRIRLVTAVLALLVIVWGSAPASAQTFSFGAGIGMVNDAERVAKFPSYIIGLETSTITTTSKPLVLFLGMQSTQFGLKVMQETGGRTEEVMKGTNNGDAIFPVQHGYHNYTANKKEFRVQLQGHLGGITDAPVLRAMSVLAEYLGSHEGQSYDYGTEDVSFDRSINAVGAGLGLSFGNEQFNGGVEGVYYFAGTVDGEFKRVLQEGDEVIATDPGPSLGKSWNLEGNMNVRITKMIGVRVLGGLQDLGIKESTIRTSGIVSDLSLRTVRLAVLGVFTFGG